MAHWKLSWRKHHKLQVHLGTQTTKYVQLPMAKEACKGIHNLGLQVKNFKMGFQTKNFKLELGSKCQLWAHEAQELNTTYMFKQCPQPKFYFVHDTCMFHSNNYLTIVVLAKQGIYPSPIGIQWKVIMQSMFNR